MTYLSKFVQGYTEITALLELTGAPDGSVYQLIILFLHYSVFSFLVNKTLVGLSSDKIDRFGNGSEHISETNAGVMFHFIEQKMVECCIINQATPSGL